MGAIQVTGAKEIQQKLATLARKDMLAAVRKGSRAGAKVIAAEVKSTAPVVSGELKKRIKVRALKRSRVRTGARVESTAPHAPLVELGYTDRAGVKHPGQRFMTEALKNKEQEALAAMEAAIDEVIAKVNQ